jgi:hypothetical protein
MKNLFLLALALVAVTIVMYAGMHGLTNNHSYGFFFLFTGAITTIGLGIDLVNQLKIRERKSNIRKLGGH